MPRKIQRDRAPVTSRQFVDIPTAANLLSIGQRTVRRHIADGKLPAYRVGGLLRIDLADLEAFARPVAPGEVSV